MSSPAVDPSRNSARLQAGDNAACAALLRGGSLSFHAAASVLPLHVRKPAAALYAFCRVADDAVDGQVGGGRDARLAAVARLSERLARAYAGRPLSDPVDRAFAQVVRRFSLPPELPEALIEGLAWDAAGRRYETIEDLHAYAARVAGSVGAMMCVLMGRREAGVLARACDLGIAMQFTNIARDVGEDARNGRLYLPRRWLGEAGIDPDAFLAKPAFTPALGGVVGRLLAEADRLYARAETGIAGLPLRCRPGIMAARLIYAEIGRELERRGCDSVGGRAVVPNRRKIALLARAPAISLRARGANGRAAAPLPAAAFLVDAVRAGHGPLSARPAERAASAMGRLVWLIGLFDRLERLERRDRCAQAPSRLLAP